MCPINSNFYKWAKHIIWIQDEVSALQSICYFCSSSINMYTENVQLVELCLFRNGSEYDILNQVNTENINSVWRKN